MTRYTPPQPSRRPPSSFFISWAKSERERAEAALITARIQGCDCRPDIRIRKEKDPDGAVHIDVCHDDRCSLWMSAQSPDN